MLYDQEPKMKAEQGSEETKEESYSFMKETIKSSRKKDFLQIAKMAFGGLLFGIFACCGFFALKPWAESTFYNETETVNIPEDEEIDTEEATEAIAEDPILSAESYEEIMQSMYDIAQEAEKSLVNIQSSQQENLEEELREIYRTTGVVVADNGQEYLILSDDSICDEANEWTAVFVDHKEYSIQLKNRDKNRGIAVFSVYKSALKSETRNVLKVSGLGNSNIVQRGNVVIALGDMFGYEGAVGYGIVSSVEHDLAFADGFCGIIATDIEMAATGSGVLVNQSGEMIGLIKNGIWKEEENHTANALAISDLKAALQLLLNGNGVPYIGTYGTMVTEEIAKDEGIPEGFYVTSVEGDSPAMQAGIQVGDIIQSIGDSEITSLSAYQRNVLNTEIGKEVKIKAQRRGAEEYVKVDFKVMIGSKE